MNLLHAVANPGPFAGDAGEVTFDAELAEIEALVDGWCGPGSHAPHPETIANFRKIIDPGLPIPSPRIFAEAHGTVDVEVDRDPRGGRAHLSVGRTRYSMYVSPAAGPTEFFDGLVSEFEADRLRVLTALANLQP